MLCRWKLTVGVNQIATKCACIWPPSCFWSLTDLKHWSLSVSAVLFCWAFEAPSLVYTSSSLEVAMSRCPYNHCRQTRLPNILYTSHRILGGGAADTGNATPTFCFSVPSISKLTTLTVESLWTAPTETPHLGDWWDELTTTTSQMCEHLDQSACQLKGDDNTWTS